MLTPGLVEVQSPGNGLDDPGGGSDRPSLFEPGVVVHRYLGQLRHFLTAKPGYAPDPAIGRESRALGIHLAARTAEEVGQLSVSFSHRPILRPGRQHAPGTLRPRQRWASYVT